MLNTKIIIFNYFTNNKYSFTKNIVDWYASMKQNYLVECDRQFVIYTDNIGVRSIIKDANVHFVYVDPNTTQDINENLRSKFKYIEDYLQRFDPQFDYFAFIQSNCRCNNHITLDELVGHDIDLTICTHNSNDPFNKIYGNNSNTIVDVSKLDTSNFKYFCAGHFLCNKDLLLKICHFINQSIEHDRKNNAFTKWHDETYFNFYLNTALLKDPRIKIKMLDGKMYLKSYHIDNAYAKISALNKNTLSSCEFFIPSQNNYRFNEHNLGDFTYSAYLHRFIAKHNYNVNFIRRDYLDRNHVSRIIKNLKCNLIVSGFFSNADSVNKFTYDSIGMHAKYIGFHFSPCIDIAVDSKHNIGCRDISTFTRVAKSNPNAYISLCSSLLASQVDTLYDSNTLKHKYVFVDCDDKFIKLMQSKLKFNLTEVEKITNWVPHHNRTQLQMEDAAFKRMAWIKQNAKKVFTTKLHAYLPCISLRIPCEFVGKIDYRTEIAKIVTSDTIDMLEPLIVKNFEHELFGTGEDVHLKLHALVMDLFNKLKINN